VTYFRRPPTLGDATREVKGDKGGPGTVSTLSAPASHTQHPALSEGSGAWEGGTDKILGEEKKEERNLEGCHGYP